MEHLTHRDSLNNPNIYEALESQLRECYGRVAYSHKAHEKCADIYHSRLRFIKLVQVILSAIITGGLIVTLFGESKAAAILAVISSTFLLALNIYMKEHDLGELIQKYINTASDLWHIRESYLSLLTDIRGPDIDINTIRSKREDLQNELKDIYKVAPRTIPKGYSVAQKALKIDEELTFSDEEIDNMLPSSLRRKKVNNCDNFQKST